MDFVQRYWSHYKCRLWMGAAGLITFFWNGEPAPASVLSFAAGESINRLVFHPRGGAYLTPVAAHIGEGCEVSALKDLLAVLKG